MMSALLLRAFFIAAVLAVCSPAGPRAQERRVITAIEGFDAYARGEYGLIADAIGRVQDGIGFTEELQRHADDWVEAIGSEQVPRRRLIVATVALEAALAMPLLRAEATKAVDLVQWACGLVRKNSTRSGEEYLWHRTALAVLQRIVVASPVMLRVPGARASGSPSRNPLREMLQRHISHAEGRFPDDPVWKLASATAMELGTWGPMTPTGPLRVQPGDGFRRDQARLALRAYRRLLTDDFVGAEAHLRSAYLELRLGNRDAVTQHLDEAERRTQDVLLLYLACLVRGQAFERAGDLERADGAYEAALLYWPRAQSAATSLAAIRFQQGRRSDALALIASSIQKPLHEDPWRRYGRGDYRLQDLIEQLRRNILRVWRDPRREVVVPHTGHGQDLFPGDPAWKMAAALEVEFGTWGLLTPKGPLAHPSGDGFRKDRARAAVRAYEELLTDEVLEAETHVRLGYLRFRSGSRADALTHLDQAEASTKNAMLLYLAAFIRGQVFEQAGDVDRAAHAYEAALRLWPGAQSAATSLAAIRSQQGRRSDALALMASSIQKRLHEDPWRRYGRGDYRLEELLQQLRRTL